MPVTTFQGTVEKGQVKLAANIRLPEKAKVYVIVPDFEEDANGEKFNLVELVSRSQHFDKQFAQGTDAPVFDEGQLRSKVQCRQRISVCKLRRVAAIFRGKSGGELRCAFVCRRSGTDLVDGASAEQSA